MSVDSANAVQVAIYAVLAGLEPGVTATDHVPPGTAFPYIVLGETEARTFGTQDASGNELTVTLHIYSRTPGMHEVKAIMAALHGALHDADLAVAGHVLVSCRHLDATARLEDDGLTRHGVTRFRILTEPV